MISNTILISHYVELEKAYIERTATSFDLRAFTSLSYIRPYAFHRYSAVTSILLPSYIELIGERAFMSTGVTALDLMFSSRCTIGYSAFYGCESLSEVHLSNCNIYPGAFGLCTSLERLYIHDSTVYALSHNILNSTPMTDSAILGYYGSIYVPSQYYSQFYAQAVSAYKERIVPYDY